MEPDDYALCAAQLLLAPLAREIAAAIRIADASPDKRVKTIIEIIYPHGVTGAIEPAYTSSLSAKDQTPCALPAFGGGPQMALFDEEGAEN
jgi:hypothetical protein